MANKTLPYFRWFPGEWAINEQYRALNDQELGFFHRLLDLSWANHGIPSDLNQLSAVMNVKRAYIDKLWPKVGLCFEFNGLGPSRLVNPKQEEQREYANRKSEQASGAVRERERLKIVRSSDDKTHDDPRASVYVSVSASASQGVQGETQIELEVDRIAAEIYTRHRIRRCPLPVAKQKLHTILAKVPKAEQSTKLTTINQNHICWCSCEKWTKENGKYMDGLEKWLNPNKHWYEEPPPSSEDVQTRLLY